MNLAQVLANTSLMIAAVFGNETVSRILAREFGYSRDQAEMADNGDTFSFRKYLASWPKMADERTLLEYTLIQGLTAENGPSEKGYLKLFTPVFVPFHVDANGKPVTQLRIYAHRPKHEEGTPIKKTEIVVRLEPWGARTRFDAQSQYAKQDTPAEAIAEPSDAPTVTVTAEADPF